MAYRVIARKWRPSVFQDVVAQDHIVQTLQNAIRSDRVVQAYLFCGPRGTGKTTMARLLAKAFNCEKRAHAGAVRQLRTLHRDCRQQEHGRPGNRRRVEPGHR